MLTLVLPPDVTARIESELAAAGSHEVGGIMMAEHSGTDEFTVREITVHRRGTFASFFRRIEDALTILHRFFDRTRRDYERFNYAGEWHSHPSFEPVPSPKDHESMRQIVSDETVGANFAVLLIVKLGGDGALLGTVHTYLPSGMMDRSNLIIRRPPSPA